MDFPFLPRRLPSALLLAASALLLLGWAAIDRSEVFNGGSGRLIRQQMVWSVLGICAMAGCAMVDYRLWVRYSAVAFVVVVLALLAVYAFPTVNGAHRWIRLGSIGVQPSEFAKLVFILALAQYLSRQDLAVGFVTAALLPMAMSASLMLLILKEPDLGTSLVFLPVLFAMLWVAGVRQRDLVRLVVAGMLLLPLLWSQMSHEQRSRVTALWEQNGPREPATADGFHLDQAKRMLAVGDVWGSFFTGDSDDSPAPSSNVAESENDSPALLSISPVPLADATAGLRIRVPEPHTDSIFCVLGERFGLVGIGAMLLFYLALVGSCLRIAAQTEEPVGRLIAVGVAALFAAEVLINTGMLVGLLPITGLSLPLISYGGSDLVAHLLALGLVVNVSMRTVCA